MRKYVFILLLFGAIFSSLVHPIPAKAQQEPLLISESIDYQFGKNIQFEAEFISELNISQIQLVILSNTSSIENKFILPISPENKVLFTYLPQTHGNIRAFTFVEYYYLVTFSDYATAQSSLLNFLYIDDRFDWNRLSLQEEFIAFWHQGDESFANNILEIADRSTGHLNQYISLPQSDDPISIISYSDSADLQTALTLTGQSWVAGHADPQSKIVFLSISPNPQEEEEINRQLPHEIAHIRLFLSTLSAYSSLPLWFTEGIASLAELTPNPDYRSIIISAYDNDQLIPLTDLCETFPTTSSGIALAYAQSDSFLRFLYQEFGKAGLNRLLQSYKEGDSCNFGLATAYGISLENLNEAWRFSTFNQDQENNGSSNLAPFLVIFGLISLSLFSLIIYSIFHQRKKIIND